MATLDGDENMITIAENSAPPLHSAAVDDRESILLHPPADQETGTWSALLYDATKAF